jgi:hypothetical protein
MGRQKFIINADPLSRLTPGVLPIQTPNGIWLFRHPGRDQGSQNDEGQAALVEPEFRHFQRPPLVRYGDGLS